MLLSGFLGITSFFLLNPLKDFLAVDRDIFRALTPRRTWFPFTRSTVTVTLSPIISVSPTLLVNISIPATPCPTSGYTAIPDSLYIPLRASLAAGLMLIER